jgi:hypothetical protein
MDINDLWNFLDFWSKSGDQPGTAPIVNDTRDFFKETGKVVDDYVLGGTFQAGMRGQDELLKQLLINAALMGGGAGVGKGIGVAGKKVAPKFKPLIQFLKRSLLPEEIGLHHSITPPSGIPFTGQVNTSVADRAFTALDQKPGYSYFWDTGKGKSGIEEALNQIDFQTRKLADDRILDAGQDAVGYVTRIPRGLSAPDENVLGTIAREVPAPQQIVGSVVGSGKPFAQMKTFSQADRDALMKLIQNEKQKQLIKSIGKISGVSSPLVGGTAYGLTRK